MNNPDRFDPARIHDYDQEGVCNRCGHDGADHAWQNTILRAEVGDDEYAARWEDTRPPICRRLPTLPELVKGK